MIKKMVQCDSETTTESTDQFKIEANDYNLVIDH